MDNLKIVTIQTNLHWENAEANRGMLEEKISKISRTVDIIILPEMFSTGFSMNAGALAEPMNLHTFKWLKNMASKANALILGSLIIKEDDKFFNRLIWMEPSGTFKTYDKRHLFRMAKEEQTYTAGDQLLIAEWKGWKICPLICYDLRFPAWSRNSFDPQTNSHQYDLLVYVANWPAARSYHWQTLLRARAIENLSFVVGVNRIGEDGKLVAYEGHSLVINPKGEIIHDAGQGEEVFNAELNAELLKNWRSKFPAFLDADDFNII